LCVLALGVARLSCLVADLLLGTNAVAELIDSSLETIKEAVDFYGDIVNLDASIIEACVNSA
jgi:hypothetical protein